jgi:hypothetical protein
MRSRTQFGSEEWLSRGAVLLTAVGVWAAGFALAGASAWRMQHPTGRTHERSETPSSAAATSSASGDNATRDTTADTTESEEGAVFMPEDGLVGRVTPRTGATQLHQR